MKKLTGLFLLNILLSVMVNAAEWQWSVPVRGGKTHTDARAWLWVPPSCQKIRAVIVAQNNMEELSILENAAFRRSMGELGFAEVWVSPPFDHTFRFTEGAGDVFNTMMNLLADTSGYTELRYSPVVGIGHSAAASWPYYFAAWNPARSLACVSVSGQWPYFRHPDFAPDIWGRDRNIDHIPSLETMGEYEAADTWSAEGLLERQAHPLMPLSMLACPAEGHFAASQQKIDYIAYFIRKAAEYRLPIHYDPLKGPPSLRPIDPIRTGWLMDRWRYQEPPLAPPAPVEKYRGDPQQAFWFFDSAMVRATEKYESLWREEKAPLLGYVQEGKVVQQRNTHLQVHLKFLPEEDGVSFVLKGVYLDTVPGESPRPAAWTGLPAGSRIGHPAGAGVAAGVRADVGMGEGVGVNAGADTGEVAGANARAIHIDRVIGPFAKINDTMFRISMEKEVVGDARNYTLTFAAGYSGDAVYKPAVQQAEMVIPAKNTEGVAQHITFLAIGDHVRHGSHGAHGALVKLGAISSAGLPVHYYVREGPAEIRGDALYFTAIPPRSRYPIRVTVVAWQYGRRSAPAVATAPSVEQTFHIYK